MTETCYIYSIIRVSLRPASGEFVNIGAIVGSANGDWQLRTVKNDSRVRRDTDFKTMEQVYESIGDISVEIYEGIPKLNPNWLQNLHTSRRNLIQFSPPMPCLASTSGQALDYVFDAMISDPEPQDVEDDGCCPHVCEPEYKET